MHEEVPRACGSLSMDVDIRPARIEDAPRLCELLAELFSMESDFSPNVEKQMQGLRLLIENNSGSSHVLVALHDEHVIGMATVQALISTVEGGRVGLVEDVIVEERSRCRGVGTLLLGGIAAWGRDKGLTRLQLLADCRNHPALNFYDSRGWSSTRLICKRMML